MIELTVSADAAGQRLDKFVRKALKGVPLSHLFKMLRTRKVRVNGARGRGEQVLAEGDRVVIRGDEERLLAPKPARPAGARGGAVDITFKVLFEDDHILVVDKPAGLATHPGSGIEGATLVEEARAYLEVPEDLPPGEFKASPAHRLDRDTSGVAIIAKTRKAMQSITELFTAGERIEKTYVALAKGKLPRASGVIDQPLSEHEQTGRSKAARGVNMQDALTRYRALGSIKEVTLLAVSIETGRTHQIRRHLQAIGHPVVGDRRYGDFPFNRQARQRWGLKRMFLHSWRLSLPHPVTGRALRLDAAMPEELADALGKMNLPAPSGP